jgi:hypothetical protein
MILFGCVGVMHSGEYDVFYVTLSVHPHPGKLKRYWGSIPTVDAHSE